MTNKRLDIIIKNMEIKSIPLDKLSEFAKILGSRGGSKNSKEHMIRISKLGVEAKRAKRARHELI